MLWLDGTGSVTRCDSMVQVVWLDVTQCDSMWLERALNRYHYFRSAGVFFSYFIQNSFNFFLQQVVYNIYDPVSTHVTCRFFPEQHIHCVVHHVETVICLGGKQTSSLQFGKQKILGCFFGHPITCIVFKRCPKGSLSLPLPLSLSPSLSLPLYPPLWEKSPGNALKNVTKFSPWSRKK